MAPRPWRSSLTTDTASREAAAFGARGRHSLRSVRRSVTCRSPVLRLKSCRCHNPTRGSYSPLTELFTEHVAPEMLYLETKWASLVPFGVTVKLLKDVLPWELRSTPKPVRNHLQRIATRMEGALGRERTSWIEDCSPDPVQLPLPEGPIVVGIDGGYVRAREPGRVRREANFEVVVGQSIARTATTVTSVSSRASTTGQSDACVRCCANRACR